MLAATILPVLMEIAHAKAKRRKRKNVEQPPSAVRIKIWCVERTLMSFHG
jgi:hypothetical protein